MFNKTTNVTIITYPKINLYVDDYICRISDVKYELKKYFHNKGA